MTTIRLSGGDRGDMPRGPLTATATATGVTDGVRLFDAAPGADTDRFRDPARLRMTAVAEAVTLRVKPVAGTAFPGGATVTVRLRSETGRAGHEVVIGPAPVGGRAGHDVVRLEPAGPDLRVSALEVVADGELGELAAAARAHTRVAIGADRLYPDRAADVVVAVDTSASMRRAVTDGSLHAALEVLTGMASVLGRPDGPAVCLLAESPVWIKPGVPDTTLADQVVNELRECGYGIGFRPPEPERNGYLLTDAPPPLPPGPGWRLVLLGPDRLAQATSGACLPAPPPGRSAGEHLLAVPGALAAFVDSLLPPPPEGS